MISIPVILVIILSCNVLLIHSHPHCPKHLISTKDIQIAWKASRHSYNDAAKIRTKIPGTQFNIVHLRTDYLYSDGTGVKVLVGEHENTTVIAFRGTKSMKQFLQQLVSVFSNFGGRKIKIDNDTVTINTYFWRAFEKLYDDIEPYLNNGSRKYIITGHSLGGAMASILAFIGKTKNSIWNHPESCLITFGQPRVGDMAYAKKHDEMIHSYRKLRFVNGRDPIPQLIIPLHPPAHHHSREVWMTKTFWRRKKYWKVCTREDPFACSKKYRWLRNIHAHKLHSYEARIMNLPKLYKDEYSHEHSNWEQALRKSCS